MNVFKNKEEMIAHIRDLCAKAEKAIHEERPISYLLCITGEDEEGTCTEFHMHGQNNLTFAFVALENARKIFEVTAKEHAQFRGGNNSLN